jgi:hypothetical protein
VAKRLGGVLLGFGVNIAGEFCISYNVRLGDMCALARFSHINNSNQQSVFGTRFSSQQQVAGLFCLISSLFTLQRSSSNAMVRSSAAINNPLGRARHQSQKTNFALSLKTVLTCLLISLAVLNTVVLPRLLKFEGGYQTSDETGSKDEENTEKEVASSLRSGMSNYPEPEKPSGSALRSSNSGESPKAVVAYAVSLTGCGSDLLTDGAAVLKHAVHLSSIHNTDSGSRYSYKMYAIVHPSALPCAKQLFDAGYTVLERETPVDVADIQGAYLKEHVEKNGCCGEKEFIKLHAYTLIDHPIVVHLDLDTLVMKPMDEIFDVMLQDSPHEVASQQLFDTVVYRQDDIEGRAACTFKTLSMPSRVDAYFTRDYNMHAPKKKVALAQGGFLVLRPSLETYKEFQELIREGKFFSSGGWGGLGYSGYGAMTFQGIIPYYYDQVRPGTSIELNRCIYNQMCDNPRDKKTVNDIVSGNCRDGREECEDCRKVNVDLVKTAHFTLCQKPWSCLNHKQDALQHRLCRKLHHEWFRVRSDLDQSLLGRDSTMKTVATGVFDSEHFFGYCRHSGEKGYIPIILPTSVSLL